MPSQTPETLSLSEIQRVLETVLLTSAAPMTLAELKKAFPVALNNALLRAALDTLRSEWEGRGVELVQLAEGWRFQTRPALQPYLERLNPEKPPRYSRATLETLAVIAYRQPVGRAEIEEIRGVSGAGVLRTLQERGLIEVVGRSEGMGRPLLYGTTPLFLELLGIADLGNLPRAEEFAIALQPPAPQIPPEEDAAAYVEADA